MCCVAVHPLGGRNTIQQRRVQHRRNRHDGVEDKLTKPQWFVFTLGPHESQYVRIWGTYEEARQKMVQKYGREWGFQYTDEGWQDWLHRKPKWLPEETLLEEIR